MYGDGGGARDVISSLLKLHQRLRHQHFAEEDYLSFL